MAALAFHPLSFSQGEKETHNHLLILGDLDPFPFGNLQILQTTQHVVLHDEIGLHAELGALLDSEGFRFQSFDGTRSGQIDGDVGTAFNFEGEGSNDAAALVFGIDVDGGG